MKQAVIDVGKIRWFKESHPIGHPKWEGDTDFRGPRTPPEISLAIEYTHNGVKIRNAIRAKGTWEKADVLYPSFVAETGLHEQLLDWLTRHSERQKSKTA